ncbi:MAG: hypothetical protein PUC99_04340 [Eubacteriales bacterium]|jgi:hypothetical protein|nr:hypothetical protein [Lachnospiraceae bacterium]MDD5859554.1 hypothetical protein [Eubacteriales bacterium]
MKNYCYFVEGQDEKKIIDTLKTELKLIQPGKVQIVNPVQERIKASRLNSLTMDTTIILVFDTDTSSAQILIQNINFIKSRPNISKVVCITQVRNLEDELLRSCSISHIRELTNSKSDREYKSDLIKISNLANRLNACGFEQSKFWAKQASGVFGQIVNQADEIRKIR